METGPQIKFYVKCSVSSMKWFLGKNLKIIFSLVNTILNFAVNGGFWRSTCAKPGFWHSWCWLPFKGQDFYQKPHENSPALTVQLLFISENECNYSLLPNLILSCLKYWNIIWNWRFQYTGGSLGSRGKWDTVENY